MHLKTAVDLKAKRRFLDHFRCSMVGSLPIKELAVFFLILSTSASLAADPPRRDRPKSPAVETAMQLAAGEKDRPGEQQIVTLPKTPAVTDNRSLSGGSEAGITPGGAFLWIFGVAGIAGCCIVLLLIWNRRLRNEIKVRKQAEDKLKKSQYFLQNVFNGLQDGISVIDAEFRILQVNQRMEKMCAHQMPLIHRKCYEVYQNRDTLCPFCPGVPTLENGKPHHEIVAYPSTENPDRWIDLWTYPLKDDQDRVVGIIEHAKDITEQRISENELRQSEKRFRDLFDSISDLVYTQDLEGRFLSVNPAMAKAFGYEQQTLVGHSAAEFMKPEFQPLFKTEYLEKLKSRGKYEGISSYFTKDGRKIYIEYHSTLVRPEHGEPYISGTGRDVTERILAQRKIKTLQEQMLQSQKMEAIGTLAGGIAHDFNNLLMGIQGNASLLVFDINPENPDYQRALEKIGKIEQLVESGTALTQQILGFARGGKYEVKPTNLNELVEKHNRMLGRTRKDITITGNYEKNLWIVSVDQGQIKQVLLNLYVNALQAMPGGGNLTVQTANVVLDEKETEAFHRPPGNYVKLSITDTGLGMDKATRQRIFEPFYTTKEMGRGTGLGLASVYGIINNHDGFITVESQRGKGTTFNIYLPATRESRIEPKPGHRKPEKSKRRSITVLLVDDEALIIDVGRQMLERLGHTVLTANNGMEAVEIYRSNPGRIDLVVLDMVMPDMGGGEIYDRLKDIDPKVKVILSSGYSINGQATEILNRGCNGFIQKPFGLNDLSEKISEVLNLC